MKRALGTAALLVLATTGCRYCQSHCDHLPPVAEIQYDPCGPRVASAFGGPAYVSEKSVELPLEYPESVAIPPQPEAASEASDPSPTPLP